MQLFKHNWCVLKVTGLTCSFVHILMQCGLIPIVAYFITVRYIRAL